MLASKQAYGLKDKHEHQYGRPNIARITKITNPKYGGTAGDRAFLVRKCKCGKYEFFDYGSYQTMKTKLNLLGS